MSKQAVIFFQDAGSGLDKLVDELNKSLAFKQVQSFQVDLVSVAQIASVKTARAFYLLGIQPGHFVVRMIESALGQVPLIFVVADVRTKPWNFQYGKDFDGLTVYLFHDGSPDMCAQAFSFQAYIRKQDARVVELFEMNPTDAAEDLPVLTRAHKIYILGTRDPGWQNTFDERMAQGVGMSRTIPQVILR